MESIMKDRTGEVLAERDRVIKSIYHMTINPTGRVNKKTQPELYVKRKENMMALGNFLLQDDTIKSYLKFNPVSVRTGKGTWRTDEYPEEWHWSRIRYISEKKGSVEDSPKQSRIHMHLSILICHTSNISLDKEEIKTLVMPWIKSWSKGVYIKLRGGGIQNYFADYVEKHLEYKDPKEWEKDDDPELDTDED